MRVTEDRLTEVLVRQEPGRHLAETNPVAAMLVESTAATYPLHAERIRHAGRFFCELLCPGDGGAATLTLPVVSHTFVREEHTTEAQMRAHLARITHRDLLLGLAAHAVLRPSRPGRGRDRLGRDRLGRDRLGRDPGECEAVLRTVYLLVRMHEIQEETDALKRALNV